MITGKIKNQIDALWNTFYTGGVTNPITVFDQLTHILFLKMLDDAQLSKEKDGGDVSNRTYKEGLWLNPETGNKVPYNSLRWHVFKCLEANDMFNTIRNDVFPFIKNLGEGDASAYSGFMRDAVFLIQNPRTLAKIVDGVDALDMDNSDIMGDVYEYALDKMAAKGNAAQFRTPKHIVRMMVELMKPTSEDEICDPAMGSGGFLVESAKYIKEHYKQNDETDRHSQDKMLHGFDTDGTMLRIAAMNLMLHGVKEPEISYRDSLSSSNDDTDKYTLILANPPFAYTVDKEDINKSLLEITDTPKTELLFVSLFIRMLKKGGRCASIVPESVLYGQSAAHVALRKELIENQKLNAVIFLPSGVFFPYTGIPTAILTFTKTDEGGTDKVWFYNVENDGFSLNKRRLEIASNDIPDLIARYHNPKGEESRTRKEKSFFVDVNDVRRNYYNLSWNTYKEAEQEKVKYESSDAIQARIKSLEKEILTAIDELNKRYL